MRVILVVAVLATVGLGAYAGLSKWSQGQATTDVQIFQVTRRSFPVILQEKGELKAASLITVRNEVEGKSTIIYLVPEGTHVKKGELLVELASNEIDDKIRDAEIKLAVAKAAHEASEKELQILKDKNASDIRKADLALWLAEKTVEKYKEGDAAQLKQTDELALQKAKYVLERAKEKLKDSEELYKKGFITRIELENDKFEEYQGGIELAKAQLSLEVTEKYTIPMNLQEKQSAVEEAKKELERAKKAAAASEAKSTADVDAKQSEFKLKEDTLAELLDQKKKARILAPADGLVVYFQEGHRWGRAEDQIKSGAQVYERQGLIELPDTSSMKVVVRVHEAKAERLKLGLSATVEIEGFSRQMFTGKVSKIAVLADSRNRWLNPNLREYETEILLDGTFTQLKPGVTARAQIQVADLTNVLAVPVQCVFGKRGRYYVFVERKGQAEPVEVQPGLSSNEYAEIKSGLNEGDHVYLAVTDEMKLTLPETGGEDEPPAPVRPPAPVGLTQPPTSGPAGMPPGGPAGAGPGAGERGPGRPSGRPEGRRGEGQPRPGAAGAPGASSTRPADAVPPASRPSVAG